VGQGEKERGNEGRAALKVNRKDEAARRLNAVKRSWKARSKIKRSQNQKDLDACSPAEGRRGFFLNVGNLPFGKSGLCWCSYSVGKLLGRPHAKTDWKGGGKRQGEGEGG